MSAFKKLNNADSFVSVFNSHKNFSVASSSFAANGITIERALYNSGSRLFPNFPNFSQSLNYRSINHLYYNNFNVTGSAIQTGSYIHYEETSLLSGSRILPTTSSIISIPKNIVGSYIKPNSLSLQVTLPTVFKFENPGQDTSDSGSIALFPAAGNSLFGTQKIFKNNTRFFTNASLTTGFNGGDDFFSDGFGAAKVSATGIVSLPFGSSTQTRAKVVTTGSFTAVDNNGVLSGSTAVPTSYTASFGNPGNVGNVFYKHGLVVLTNEDIINNFATSSISWESTQPIFTSNYYCKAKSSEFIFSTNPSACKAEDNLTDSIAYSGGEIADNVSGSEFKPYVTTVGLYNDSTELIAVAKLGQPIPKSKINDTVFVVKLDV